MAAVTWSTAFERRELLGTVDFMRIKPDRIAQFVIVMVKVERTPHRMTSGSMQPTRGTAEVQCWTPQSRIGAFVSLVSELIV